MTLAERSLKADQPHGKKSLYAQKNGVTYEAQVFCVPQSTYPMN